MNFSITEQNEVAVVAALRTYYRENFTNGQRDESFLLWIETCLDAAEADAKVALAQGFIADLCQEGV